MAGEDWTVTNCVSPFSSATSMLLCDAPGEQEIRPRAKGLSKDTPGIQMAARNRFCMFIVEAQ